MLILIGKVNGWLTKQLTTPVNTTRIVITLQDGAKTLANNRELIGQYGGLGDGSADKNGSISSLQITLGGQSLPSPAYNLNFKTGQTIVPWADWQSFFKAGINGPLVLARRTAASGKRTQRSRFELWASDRQWPRTSVSRPPSSVLARPPTMMHISRF